MPQSFLCIAARGVIRDVATNQISVFNIVEGIKAETYPVLVPDVGVLAMWRRIPEDVDRVELQFRATVNGRETFPRGPVVIAFEPDSNIHRSIVAISNLLIPEPGNVEFSFLQGEQVIARYTFPATANVRAQQVPDVQQPAEE